MNLPRFTARHWATAILFAALATLAQAHDDHSAANAPSAQGADMGRPARAQLATGAALAPDGSLWIVGLDAQGKLFTQQSPARALGQWTAPQVLPTSDEISADGENRPKIAFGPKDMVVVSYTQPLAKPYTGFIRMLRSTDGGLTFSAPFTVHQDRREITHRFESIAFDGRGDLHTLWVDKRDQPPKGSGKAYVGAAVYRNVSHDGGASFGPDIKLADHSCECCRIALAAGPDGQFRALWRHVFGDQTRDHALAVVGPETPNAMTRASFDEWQINACPHHGPGLAPAADGYHAVWFGIRQTNGQSNPAVRYGRLKPDGTPIANTVRALPDPRAEHADVASHGEHVAVVWRSSQGTRTSLWVWLSRDGGQTFERNLLAEGHGNNDHPRLVQSGARMVVVWRQSQEVQVHEITF